MEHADKHYKTVDVSLDAFVGEIPVNGTQHSETVDSWQKGIECQVQILMKWMSINVRVTRITVVIPFKRQTATYTKYFVLHPIFFLPLRWDRHTFHCPL
jgi:hypothetical protein